MTEPTKSRKGIYLLPNLLTTGSLFAGFYAIVSANLDRFEQAAIAIFIAMVLDGLDGRVARLTNTESSFGKEYDSLSDMVSFGLAPALVMFEWSLQHVIYDGWLHSSLPLQERYVWHVLIRVLPIKTSDIFRGYLVQRQRE